jgi:hypothetical protein
MSRTRFVVLIAAILAAGLVVVVTLVAIDTRDRYEECIETHVLASSCQ